MWTAVQKMTFADSVVAELDHLPRLIACNSPKNTQSERPHIFVIRGEVFSALIYITVTTLNGQICVVITAFKDFVST